MSQDSFCVCVCVCMCISRSLDLAYSLLYTVCFLRKQRALLLWQTIMLRSVLTLILLMWKIGWASNNASRWQMGFNSAFKGSTTLTVTCISKTNHASHLMHDIFDFLTLYRITDSLRENFVSLRTYNW